MLCISQKSSCSGSQNKFTTACFQVITKGPHQRQCFPDYFSPRHPCDHCTALLWGWQCWWEAGGMFIHYGSSWCFSPRPYGPHRAHANTHMHTDWACVQQAKCTHFHPENFPSFPLWSLPSLHFNNLTNLSWGHPKGPWRSTTFYSFNTLPER